jgi:hypothetical protein
MAPVPTTLRYRRLVSIGLAANAINLSTSAAMGHRVQVSMSAADINAFFYWSREVGSPRAIGHFSESATNADGNTFAQELNASLATPYTDMDAVADQLNFNSSVLDSSADPRLRGSGVISANDLVVAYVLFKCYGSSTYVTSDVVYNLEDAQNMLTNEQVSGAIVTNLAADDLSGAGYYVDNMFTNLLAADPMRFFDASGKQVAGLFETNADASGSGSWNLVAGDKLELPMEFAFTAQVTTASVIDSAGDLSGNTDKTVVLEAGDKFNVRLQIIVS